MNACIAAEYIYVCVCVFKRVTSFFQLHLFHLIPYYRIRSNTYIRTYEIVAESTLPFSNVVCSTFSSIASHMKRELVPNKMTGECQFVL